MIEVRAMKLGDVATVSALRVTGWRAAYADIVPHGYLAAMSADEDAPRRRDRFRSPANPVDNLVATDTTGAVIGWAALGPLPEPASGELLALYVLPDRIGSGVGRLLLDAVRSRATARGFHRLDLWVLAANTRARRFYERSGFTPDGAERTETYDGVPLQDVRYVGPATAPGNEEAPYRRGNRR
ncbi:GNAT family N-acetyltransferase [Streptomyces sp. NPDC059897]|uniref:GNAT family N-acetyltransferase n=1 Tax=Streptomyces sp. NPDC059897 TaxID=3346994 RepID=UPI0036678DFF